MPRTGVRFFRGFFITWVRYFGGTFYWGCVISGVRYFGGSLKRGFVISGFCIIHFTITELKNVVRYTEAFVRKRLVISGFCSMIARYIPGFWLFWGLRYIGVPLYMTEMIALKNLLSNTSESLSFILRKF